MSKNIIVWGLVDSNHQSQRERIYSPCGYQLPVTTPFVEAEGLEPPTPYGSGFTSEFLSLLLTYTLCKHLYSIRRVYHFTTLQCFSKNFFFAEAERFELSRAYSWPIYYTRQVYPAMPTITSRPPYF